MTIKDIHEQLRVAEQALKDIQLFKSEYDPSEKPLLFYIDSTVECRHISFVATTRLREMRGDPDKFDPPIG